MYGMKRKVVSLFSVASRSLSSLKSDGGRPALMNFYNKHSSIPRHVIKLFHCSSRKSTVGSQQVKTEDENKLLKYLNNKIEATGPITVAEYMKEVLVNPYSGYYMNRDVFGSAGDYITSPEISQMFGELIAVWFYNEWCKIGQPKPFQIIEFGPGRGTLAEDILRVFRKLNVSEETFSVHLVEISPHLQKMQQAKLCDPKMNAGKHEEQHSGTTSELVSKFNYPITWHSYLNNLPHAFTLFLAHEFFDALPIHKFKKTTEGWREILIDCKDSKLQYVISRGPTPASQFFISSDEKRNEMEVCVEGGLLMDKITTKMKEDGGISLIVDYGYLNSEKSDTFRGFQTHALHDPLIDPGKADLTADVDFQFLMNHASRRAVSVGPVTQASFLKNMGIDVRLEKLLQNCLEEEKASLKTGYNMLMNEREMGERFKFLALYPLVLKDFMSKCRPYGFL